VIRIWAAALAAVLLTALPARAQDSGVLLVTSTERIPLRTYAEMMNTGVLRMSSGLRKDIPTIHNFQSIRCNLTGWRPMTVMAAPEALFTSERSERRLLPIATRPVGVTAVSVRVSDLESPARIAAILKAIGMPEGGDEAYFFLVLTSGDMTRYYPFRMSPRAK
jgi:hypothetical protein